MNAKMLAESLAFERLQAHWEEYLTQWKGGTPEQIDEVREFIASIHRDVFTALQDTSDPYDRQALVYTQYLRLRAHWMALSMQIAYQVSSGRSAELLCMQSSLLSWVMEALKAHIVPEVAAFLDRVVNDPVVEAQCATHTTGKDLGLSFVPAEVATVQEVRRLRDELYTKSERVATLEAEKEAFVLAALLDDPTEKALSKLHEQLLALRQQVVELKAFQEILLRETHQNSPENVIPYLRAMTDQMTELAKDNYWLRYAHEILYQEFGNTPLHDIVLTMRQEKARSNRMEDEVGQARRERELLLRELGSLPGTDPLQAVRQVCDRRRKLEAENAQMRRDYETLLQSVGQNSLTGVLQYVRELHDRIYSLSHDLREAQAERTLLEVTIGTSDAKEIINQFRTFQTGDAQLSDTDIYAEMQAALALLK